MSVLQMPATLAMLCEADPASVDVGLFTDVHVPVTS